MNKKLILFICVSMAQQISCGEFQTKKVLHPMLEKQQVATMVADTLDVCANRSQPRPNPFSSAYNDESFWEDDCLSSDSVQHIDSDLNGSVDLKLVEKMLEEDSDPETDLMTTDIDLLTDETDLMTSETDIMSEEDSDTSNEPVQKKLKAELSSPIPVVVQIQRKSDKKYKCDHEGCNYAAAHSSSLIYHKRTHTGEKPYKCDYAGCNFAAATSGNLADHKRIHTGEKPYKCDHEGCNYAAAHSSRLICHKRTHTGEKPYKCDYAGCNFAAAHSNSLIYHKRTHTGEKPYKCDYAGCNFAAATSSSLICHKRTHTGENLFECQDCHFKAAALRGLTNHRKDRHESPRLRN